MTLFLSIFSVAAAALLLVLTTWSSSSSVSAQSTAVTTPTADVPRGKKRITLDAPLDVPYYQPGFASWLGGEQGWDDTPENYEDYFPIAYVVFGFGGWPHLRTIVTEGTDCPKAISRTDPDKVFERSHGAVYDIRASGRVVDNNQMPYKFPVQVCSIIAGTLSGFRQALNDGDVVLSYKGKTHDIVPVIKRDPSRFLLTGDTGLRSKPSNLGLGELGKGNCDAREVYGVHQCYENFTEDDIDFSEQTGSFQGNDEWVFKDLADDASTKDIDVIVYVGDYLYRQGPCPINNTDSLFGQRKNCSGLNVPPVANTSEVPEDVIINFLPGYFGDNWWGWWADFFWPAMKLLQSAPIIPTRGNHEICSRGGYGYFFFMSPQPMCPTCSAQLENFCETAAPPYTVLFENEQFLVIDDAMISPYEGGIDHFEFNPGSCPDPPVDGNKINVTQEPRTDELRPGDISFYTQYMQMIEEFSLIRDNNFYVGHRPLFGIACNDTNMATLDWTLQQSLGIHTLDRISALINGHMHWFELLEFENNELPPQMVVGHGGTKLIPNYVNQSIWPHLRLDVGAPGVNISGNIKRGISRSQYGYGIMERTSDGDYEVEFYFWNNETRKVEVQPDFSLLIPKGPRVSCSGAQCFTANVSSTSASELSSGGYGRASGRMGATVIAIVFGFAVWHAKVMHSN